MFCRFCGNQLPDDAQFCSRCGKPVADSSATTQPQPTPTAGGFLQFIKSHKAVAIAACAALVAVCGIVVSSMGHHAPPVTGRPGSGGDSSVAAKPVAVEAILVADPGPFFNVEPDEVEEDGDGFRYTYTMSLSHTIIDEYLDVLAVHYDLEPSDTQTSISEDQYFFDIPLEMKVEYNHPKSSMMLTLTCGEGVQLEDSGVESSHPGWESTAIPHSSGSSKAPAPSSGLSSSSGSSKASSKANTPKKSDLTVPDMVKFFQCTLDTAAGEYCVSIDDKKGPAAVEEYRKLLESWNFKETFTSTYEYAKEGIDRFNQYNYYYDYTGTGKVTGEVDWFSPDKKESDIILCVHHYTTENRILVSVKMKDCFTAADPGATASEPPSDKNGTAGSGSGSSFDLESREPNIPEFAKQDCLICKGTKKCQTCGGRGYLYSRASGKYDRNCTDCYNCSGKCHYCNGTGKR